MNNSYYVDLSLWFNNTPLFQNIRTYLCHINSNVLHYIINSSRKTIHMKSCAYKTRGYLSFLNHVNNLCKFQKKFRLYYKRHASYNLMSSKYIYIVSLLLDNSLPKIYIFSNKKCAINFAFKEATQFINTKLPYSDDGNYILTHKKNKIIISTHYTLRDNIYKEDSESIYMTTSPKIIYDNIPIPFSIDLKDSGSIDFIDNPVEEDEYASNIEEHSNTSPIESSYDPSSNNIRMELDDEYVNTNIDELFNIISITNNKNDTNPVDINTHLLHTSFDTYPRIMRHSFSKINDDVNFWDTDNDDDDDDNDKNDDSTTDEDYCDGSNNNDGDDDENADMGLSLHDFYDKYKIKENSQDSNKTKNINKSDL